VKKMKTYDIGAAQEQNKLHVITIKGSDLKEQCGKLRGKPCASFLRQRPRMAAKHIVYRKRIVATGGAGINTALSTERGG